MPRPALPRWSWPAIAVVFAAVRVCDGAAPSACDSAWLSDYGLAYERAEAEQRMLLIHFQAVAGDADPEAAADMAFLRGTLRDAQVQSMLQRYITVRVPLSQQVCVNGRLQRLIDHAAFEHMHGKAGLAIVDLAHADKPYYRRTVSCLPFESPAYGAPPAWSPVSLRVLLELPAAALTQRTLIYAVRCHAEKPACTCARCDAVLAEAASSHARHQASIRLQGHHNWDARFQRLYAQLGGEPPTEVCAESWPNEPLVKAAFSCVHSWRQSPGHWSALKASHPAYGFDIARGSNGVWYAAGIFGGS